MSRRKALLGALFAGAAITSKTAEASDANCSCLPAPDCNAVCPNGGSPRGDGTQACDCFENPPMPTLAQVAYTGKYADLLDKPRHAASDQENGDALNAKRWNGVELRKNYNSSATQIPVFSGGYLDYINKADISGQLPQIGAKTYTVAVGNGWKLSVERDAYGRVANFESWNTNCNCCNCGDDSNCFIVARLKTTKGFKDVKDIQVGEKLVGIDGIHTVVAVVKGTLNARQAVRPVNSKGAELWLTEEHVVLNDSKLKVFCEDGRRKGVRPVVAENGIQGVYVSAWMAKMLDVDSEAFEIKKLPEDTTTYTLIVDRGHWGMAEDGTSVLLCEML